jgi:hypothetical protein
MAVGGVAAVTTLFHTMGEYKENVKKWTHYADCSGEKTTTTNTTSVNT